MTESARALSRRGLLGLAGAGVAGAALGVGGDRIAMAVSGMAAPAQSAAATYPIYAEHQAGIVTPAQDRLHFAAFDVADITREELIALLHDWTLAAARMTTGAAAGEFGPASGPYDAPPDDTGEALDLPAAGLTITFGFGPLLFDSRFGLTSQRPASLVDLPHFPGDALRPELTGATYVFKRAVTTHRLRFTPSATCHGSPSAARTFVGHNSASAARRRQLGAKRRHATSSASKTEPRISKQKTRRSLVSNCGLTETTVPRGWREAPT